jgi:glycosyltransferase involved in cell wall biosynthesis
MATPLVSVSMVTYNHEAYVAEAARSVLDQTFGDLELVVVNDGSTDRTAAQLAEISDPRLVVIHQDNAGPSAATNRAFSSCRGKYIALFSGDDVCHPDRIRRQLDEYNRGGRRVLFSACDFIDDDGQSLPDGHFATTAFDLENRPRPVQFARLFYRGNFFNGVSVFTERHVLPPRPYDPGLLQLQDFDLWARLIKQHDVFIMPDRLVRYRIRGASGNLSSPTRDRLTRLQNEYYLVHRRFFDGVSADFFREAFTGELVNPDFADGPEHICEQAFAFGRSQMPLARLIGLERLHALLADPETADVLARRYRFTNRSYFELLGSIDVTQAFDGGYSSLFVDTGSAWDPAMTVCQRVASGIPAFAVTFALSNVCRPRSLRWDPVELQTCRVRIDAIELVDAAGQIRLVDLQSIEFNGERLRDGTVSFATADPMFWWPVEGEVASVTIRGRWETDDAFKTVLAQNRRIQELTDQFAEAQRQLRNKSAYGRMTAPLRAVRAVTRRLRAG